MTSRKTQLESKRNAVAGTLTQAKGVARERWGQVTNNPKMQLAGKKDKVAGTLQKSLGNSWAFRHKNLVLAFTAVAALMAAVSYYFNRANKVAVAAGHYDPLYPRKV
jgi:uncharacterized protein YjbJ (UPF0337 family)